MSRTMTGSDDEAFRAILRYNHPTLGPQEKVFGPYDKPGTVQGRATSNAPNNLPYEIDVQVTETWRTIKTISR